MIELIEANWWLFLIALLIGIAVAWLVFKATRRTKVTSDTDTEARGRDVLDDDAAPAARNQALIDSAPNAAAPVIPPVAAPGLAGAGTAVSAAVHEAQAEAAPAPAEPRPTPTRAAGKVVGDDLTRIKGVGPKLRALLGELGVVTFAQVAAWSDGDIARIDAQLGRFAGRIERDDWRTQAKLLDAGDTAAYAAKFGNL